MKESEILVFGDVMVDHYIYGSVTRISPEAPIPVVLRKKDDYILGGAANVAANLKNLQMNVHLVGLKGKDSSGNQLESKLQALGISSCLISDDSFVTTCKSRIVAQNHQMLRVDTESTPTLTDEHFQIIKEQIKAFQGSYIVLSDYNKGICTFEICQWIIEEAKKRNIKVLVDPKENDWEKFKGAFLIKPNLKELQKIVQVGMNELELVQTNESVWNLMKDLDVQHILLTKGGEGMSLFSMKEVLDILPHKVDVFDVTGAGDTVIAVLAYALHNGKSIKDACKQANDAAAFVITKKNTYAISLQDLNS